MSEIKQITQVEELYRYAKRCADSTMPDEAAAFALAAETIESQQAEIERLKRAINSEPFSPCVSNGHTMIF